MAVNTVGSVDVPCSLFAGLNTELAPSDIPEGVSPDNQDVIFLPGSVQSRPGLHKLYTAIAGNPTIVYAKTYVQPNGNPITLLLDSAGVLWKEDVVNSPGVLTQLASYSAGLYAQSVSFLGREYIALSDGVHGAWAPLQYDGTFLDRVSQDGPGAGPSVMNYLPPAATLSGAGAGAPVNLTASTVSDPYTPAPPSGGGGGSCFCGSVPVKTVDGWQRFDSLPEGRFLVIGSGNSVVEAELLVTEYAGPMLDFGNGALGKREHFFLGAGGFIPARQMFPDLPLAEFSGKVYNLHLFDEWRTYWVMLNGTAYEVHNLKPIT